MLQKKVLPPIILLEGMRSLGKRLFSFSLSAQALCKENSLGNGLACKKCSNCKLILLDRHPDVKVLNQTSDSIKISEARSLKEHLSSQPYSGSYRIGMIFDVDKITNSAVNFLLKNFEEPHERQLIIMTTSRYRDLPKTLLSRVTRWHIKPPHDQTLEKNLEAQVNEYSQKSFSIRELIHKLGPFPGKIIDYLSKDYEIDTKQKEEFYAKILTAKSITEIYQLNDSLQKKTKLSDLVYLLEKYLNDSYRGIIENGNLMEKKFFPHENIRKKRKILAELHQLRKKQIPINLTLAIGALGIAAHDNVKIRDMS